MIQRIGIWFLGILLLCTGQLSAQSEEQVYNEELVYGLNFNTNAGMIGGFMFKWAKEMKPGQYRSLGVELAHVKHPKEYRFKSYDNGNSFIGYKTNYLFVLRPHYGREFLLFRKAAEEGVHVNLLLEAGPSVAMLKKYYVLYQETPDPRSNYYSVPYTPDLNLNQIYGVGPFGDGLGSIQYTPGIHFKGALSFEFGQFKSSVAGLETGFVLEKFTRTQQILAFAPNRSFFSSIYITLYFGKKY